MSSRTQAFVLLLFGGALLRLATTDALLRYVRPVARPWVLLAGAAIVALALWSLFARSREVGDGPGDADEHGHHGSSRAAWLVLAPVVAILVIAPPALGAYSAKRLPVSAIKPPSRYFPALADADPVPVSLLDYYSRAAFDDGRTLTAHHIALTGFVLRGEPGGFQLARLVITCCAADAQPVVVSVQTQMPAPSRDTWVTVTGTFDGMSPSDATVPVLRADAVTSVHQPANPYD
ncbi:MAG TPA: TIGR03943 family protein [Jatrophihabitantaceae bacterium]